jgi:Holliday junction DNA helicase RuvA
MIASVRGIVAEKAAGTVIVDVQGVGYLVQISAHTQASLPEKGGEVFLRTRHVVREDAALLFGFADVEELRLFDLVIGVSGVGPRLALALLSGLKPGALAKAIHDEQVGALVAVPGIGRKTAERLIVELRDKVEAPKGAAPATPVLPKSQQSQDAVAALTRLGYTPAQAQEALREVTRDGGTPTLEEVVRKALAHLGKSAALAR